MEQLGSAVFAGPSVIPVSDKARACRCGTAIEPVSIEGHPDYYPRLCPTCEVIQDQEEQRSRTENLRRRLGVRPRFLTVTFDNLCEPKPPAAVIATCKLFAASALTPQASHPGLYLWSRTNGTGKTHLAAAIALTVGDGFFVNTAELLEALRESIRSDGRCETYTEALTAPLLVLDDLGAQHITDWGEERLYVLLNRRYDSLLPLVVTSNLPPDLLHERVGARIASRVREMCAALHVDSVDHRVLKGRTIC